MVKIREILLSAQRGAGDRPPAAGPQLGRSDPRGALLAANGAGARSGAKEDVEGGDGGSEGVLVAG